MEISPWDCHGWLFFCAYFILLSLRISSIPVFHSILPHPDLISDHIAPPAGQQRGNMLFTDTWYPLTQTAGIEIHLTDFNRIVALMLYVFIAFQGQELVLQSIIAFTIICTLTQCNPVQNDFFFLIRKLNVTLLNAHMHLRVCTSYFLQFLLFKSRFVALGFKINNVCPACFCIIHTTIGLHFPLVHAQGRGRAVYTSHLSCMFVLHSICLYCKSWGNQGFIWLFIRLQ